MTNIFKSLHKMKPFNTKSIQFRIKNACKYTYEQNKKHMHYIDTYKNTTNIHNNIHHFTKKMNK